MSERTVGAFNVEARISNKNNEKEKYWTALHWKMLRRIQNIAFIFF